MRNDYFDFLCCPKCKSDLLESDNFLVCLSCKKRYEIKDDIPVFIDLNNLPKHLYSQIKFFENESITDKEYRLDAWQKSYLKRFNDNFPEITDKVIIDCGTGSGYMAIGLTERGGAGYSL